MQALHGPFVPRGTGTTSPSSGFVDFQRLLNPPAGRLDQDALSVPVYASETTIVASEFNRRLLILIGGFTYSHSVYHANPASPVGPIDPTSLSTYTADGIPTVGTLGTTFGAHQYWESWEYGVHALNALTQTLNRSGGMEIQIGLFETPISTVTDPPKAGSLVPSGKLTPDAMPAAAATVVSSGGPTQAQWTTLFESLHVSPGFGNTNLTFANKSMFLLSEEDLTVNSIHGKLFGDQVGLSGIDSFLGIPTSIGPFSSPFSWGGGPTPPSVQGYLVKNYGDRGAVTFPNSEGEFLGPTGDRARWWYSLFLDDSWANGVTGIKSYFGPSSDQRQEPHHILYSLSDAIRREAFQMVNKSVFPDRTNVFAADTQMPIQGFPPDDVQASAGSTPGTVEVSWTAHIAAPDDGTSSRWNIYVTLDSSIIEKVKYLRDRGSLFTTKNVANGLEVRALSAINKINTPGYVEVFEGYPTGSTLYVTMTNRHFNGYLLRSTRGYGVGQTSQQGQVEIAESEIFTPFRSVVVP